jgi:hypothetical protein
MATSEKVYEHECAHPPCGCPVENEGDYCSDWCEKAFDETDCGCGHPDCRAEA